MQTINATFVKNHISDCWKLAQEGPVSVESAGKEIAVILSSTEYKRLTGNRVRKVGFAKHLFEGVDIDALLATPIPGIEEYMP